MQKIILLNIFFLIPFYLFAQIEQDTSKNKKIEIVHSNTLSVNEVYGPDVKILVGEVEFYHDSATMFCDSAYFNSKLNQFTAYNNIQLSKPSDNDTLMLFGDTLVYDGISKLARVRSNVVLSKDSMTLYTDSLDYDMIEDIAYYSNGGRTENGEDTLISDFGYYYSDKDELFFKDNVIILNPKYTITSDTLMHNLKTKVSNFYGPTEIVSDSNYIYCENGWYDHQNDKSQFNENAYLESKEKSIKGDSLYYDRKNGIGRAFKNVLIKDTLQNMLLYGNYGEYFEKTGRSMVTDRALFVQIYEGDSIFLHADTLKAQVDTSYTSVDTTIYRLVRGYYKVKLYNTGFQAQCDSLVYSMLDSVIYMYYDPILWNEENQLTAKFIKMKMIENQIRRVDMKDSTFIVSQKDSIRFDQVLGKEMVGYVENNELYQVDVSGETQTIYFILDDKFLMGINKVTSSSMTIYLKENKIDKIWFYTQPKGVIYPPYSLTESELYLPGFKWLDDYRPKSKEDVFIWKSEKTDELESDILPEDIILEEEKKP